MQHNHPSSLPSSIKFETKRLWLRELIQTDDEFLFSINRDPDVMKYVRKPETDIRQTQEKLVTILQEKEQLPHFGLFPLHLKSDLALIGWVVLKYLDESKHIEVGYRLHKKYWGNGYATEAAERMVSYGFEELKLAQICGITHPENMASRRVLEKCGLTFKRMDHFYDTDVTFYEISADEYYSRLNQPPINH